MNFLELSNLPAIYARMAEVEPGLTWGRLAKQLGVAASTVSTWKRAAEDPRENGPDRQLPLKALLTWAFERKIDPTWLLTGEGSPRPSGPDSSTDQPEFLSEFLSWALERIKEGDNPDFRAWLKFELASLMKRGDE